MNDLIQATMNYVSAHPYLVSAGVALAGSATYGVVRYVRSRSDPYRRTKKGLGAEIGSAVGDSLDALSGIPGKTASKAGSAFHGAGGFFGGAGASGAYEPSPDLPGVDIPHDVVDADTAGSLLETIGEGAAKIGEGLVEIISNIDP